MINKLKETSTGTGYHNLIVAYLCFLIFLYELIMINKISLVLNSHLLVTQAKQPRRYCQRYHKAGA